MFRPVGAFSCVSQLIHLVRGWSSLLPVPCRHSWWPSSKAGHRELLGGWLCLNHRAWTSSLIQFDCWSSVCCLEVGYCWLMLRREDKIVFYFAYSLFQEFLCWLGFVFVVPVQFSSSEMSSSLISLAFPLFGAIPLTVACTRPFPFCHLDICSFMYVVWYFWHFATSAQGSARVTILGNVQKMWRWVT